MENISETFLRTNHTKFERGIIQSVNVRIVQKLRQDNTAQKILSLIRMQNIEPINSTKTHPKYA